MSRRSARALRALPGGRSARRRLPQAPGRRWLIYLRNSKTRRTKTGETVTVSLDVQESACRQGIARHDPAPASIVVVKDEGRSGGGGRRRPGRDLLRSETAAGRVDAVIAYNAKRIGRNLKESVDLWDDVVSAGAFITTVDCGDLDNASVRGVLFGQAEEEWKERQRYSLAAIDWRRGHGLCGIKTGSAYGLRWDEEQLVRDHDEFPVVELIYELYAGERPGGPQTMGQIARELSRRRIPRRDVPHHQWDTSAVSRILYCTWYAGVVPDGYDDDEAQHYWRAPTGPFIAPRVDEVVKSKLRTVEATGQRLDHALSGLLFCGICGGWSPMSLCWSKKQRADGSVLQRPRYRCVHRVRDVAFCAGQSIDSELVERMLLDIVRAEVGGGELAHKRFARRTQQQAEAQSGTIAALDARVTAIHDEQDSVYAQRRNGETPKRIADNEMKRLMREEESLLAERAQLAHRTVLDPLAAQRLLATVQGSDELEDDRWFALAPSQRNEFLRLLLPDGVLIYPPAPRTRPGDITGRVGPRGTEDAKRAEAARVAPGSALMTAANALAASADFEPPARDTPVQVGRM